ncbi:MAG: hypothetical protein Q4B36_00540 [Tissierellia bacterium]|nr:hypothetical protein [Tissierellia bacterium]
MKKIIIPIIILIVALFSFKVYSVNKNYPTKDKIERYSIKDTIEYENLDIQITGFKINKKPIDDKPRILDVYFEVINNNPKDMDIINTITSFSLYQDFSNSPIQNILENDLKSSYEDFLLKPNEKKKYTFKYIVENNDNNRDNFIYMNNRLYKDEYNNSFDKGLLLYKVIDLGDIYE